MQISKHTLWLARLIRGITKHYWLPQRPREKLCRAFFKFGRLSSFPFIVPLHGIDYYGDFSLYQDWRIYFLGSFERETINLLTHILRSARNATFVDIGANNGLFSAVLAAHCASVHAFEPYPPVYEMMSRLLAKNQIRNVTMHPVALGTVSELKPFYPPGGFNIGVGSFFREHQNDARVKPIELRIERGDDYFAEHVGHVDAIKIDTEGFEALVLTGLRRTLDRYRPWVVFETSQTTQSTVAGGEEFVRLFPDGYEFFLISDHTRLPRWRLTPLEAGWLFGQFGNLLACPKEKRQVIADTIQQASA